MKKEFVIPIRFIIIFFMFITIITIWGGWGAVIDAITEIFKFVLTMGVIALVSFGIYKIGSIKRKNKNI
jgi:hypothetical protein